MNDFNDPNLDEAPLPLAPLPLTPLPPDPLPLDGVIGDPRDIQFGESQKSLTSCAVVAAGGVIHAMTGHDIPEYRLEEVASTHGLYDEGTLPEHFGKLLGVYEIPYHVNESGTMQDIVKELAYGRKILVAVDGTELWGHEPGGWLGDVLDWIQETIGIGNHAVWVIAIDVSDPDDIKVIVNDSGPPDGSGVGRAYSLDEFIDAAEDTRFHYVATNEAAPGASSGTGPDPDLATFPKIKDYYEIRYNESLVLGNVESTLAAPEYEAQQESEFYLTLTWPESDMVQSHSDSPSVEVTVKEILRLNHVAFLIEQIDPELKDKFIEDHRHIENRHLANQVVKKYSLSDVQDYLREEGVKIQIKTGIRLDHLVSYTQDFPNTQIISMVDEVELKTYGNAPGYFWEKFKEKFRPEKVEVPKNIYMLIIIIGKAAWAAGTTLTQMGGSILDIGDDNSMGLVIAEFDQDKSVKVTWPDGDTDRYSHWAFERAFNDLKHTIICGVL